MNDVAIIIDCWDTWYSKNKIEYSNDFIMFKNIKKFIEESPNIGTIILASYNVTDAPVTVWHKNSIELIGQERFNKKDLISHLPVDEYRETCDEFLSWKTNRFQISMHYIWELEIFLEKKTIGNIYLCGQSTDQCVLNRPLGWESLYKFIKDHNLNSKILLHKDCVNDDNGNTFVVDKNPGWHPTTNSDIFQYFIK